MSPALPRLPLGMAELRAPRRSDAAELARHANDREVWRNLRDRFPHPYELEDAEDWLQEQAEGFRAATWVIAVADAAVGAIGLHPGDDVHRFDAEIGFWLGREWWGRGIMSAAVRAVTEFGFGTLKLARIHAVVFGWNRASARVLQKAGYLREGVLRDAVHKDGETIDGELWAATARSWPRAPAGVP